MQSGDRGGTYMALIKCRECGKDLSRQAKTCPSCGAPGPTVSLFKTLALLASTLVVAIAFFQALGKTAPTIATTAEVPTIATTVAPRTTPVPSEQAPQQAHRQSLTIKGNSEVDRYLQPFKTRGGKPLRAFLKSQGLTIEYIQADPIENYLTAIARTSKHPGDWYVSIAMIPSPLPKLPCGMDRIYKIDLGVTFSTLTARDNHFVPHEGNEDALLHWAATGKCLVD